MKTCEQYTIINPFWEFAHIEDVSEGKQRHLTGFIDGDSNRVTTSMIVAYDLENNTVTTKSGSIYKLGNPLPNYALWLVNPDQAL